MPKVAAKVAPKIPAAESPGKIGPAFPGLPTGLSAKLICLENTLRSLSTNGEFGLAFSGGLDSRFLAYFAQQAGLRPVILHARGPHYPRSDTASALAWAVAHNLEPRVVAINPLDIPQVANNAKDRCYHCKFHIFSRMKAQISVLADGAHSTDAQSYRPGLRAGAELEVASPLTLAGMSKADIHQSAVWLGLDNPAQQARPCLLTRFAYGLPATEDMLGRLDLAEREIAALLTAKLDPAPAFRLRLLPGGQLELHLAANDPPKPVPEPLVTSLANIISKTMPMPLNRLQYQETLSGFFDRSELN